MRILFVTTEVYPLIKIGGLADVAGALTSALAKAGEDVRLLLPAYRGIIGKITSQRIVADISNVLGWRVHLIEGYIPDSGITVLLVSCPQLFDRSGTPYNQSSGNDWPDNHERFAVLSMVAANLAAGEIEYTEQKCTENSQIWRADVVHANDWQTGLVPAYLKLLESTQKEKVPASVFTVHNLSFQGRFPLHVMERISLPLSMFSGVEFYGDVSYLKAGLYYSDYITTVSPTYAREIQTGKAGEGLHGLLLARADSLVGILNGKDDHTWNPEIDPIIHYTFTSQKMIGKILDKAELQRQFELDVSSNAPLLAIISRLTEQKGIDLVLKVLPSIIEWGGQLVILGAGDFHLEAACLAAAKNYPGQVAVHIGFSETLAHRIQAGSDVLLMPSRFEPCGLSQIYAMRYGTLPVVHHTGGLADTVIDISDSDSGTGFVFYAATVPAFLTAIHRAFKLYQNYAAWRVVQRRAMEQDFSWRRSAELYQQLYHGLAKKVVFW